MRRYIDPLTGCAIVWALALSSTAGSVATAAAAENVTFRSSDVELAGTLHRPRGNEPVGAVVLIHGSGPEDRSGLRHLARALSQAGFAALAYDKRGVGKSGGDPEAWQHFSFEDLAADAVAGVAFLADRPDIDSERIGVLGVSQGGWVAPLAAARSPAVSFLIAVSASVTTVAEDRLFERAARLRREGFSEKEIAEVHAMQLLDQEVTRSGERFDEFAALWERNRQKRWFERVYLSEQPIGVEHEYRRWYRTVLDFDPVPVLERLSIPSLFLFGDPALDRFGPVEKSLAILESLRAFGREIEIRSFTGADHSLRIVGSGGKPGRDAPWRAALTGWLEKR